MTDQQKHTPGPWKMDVWQYDKRSPIENIPTVSNKKFMVCQIHCDTTAGNNTNPYCPSFEEGEANARLIAAAPDLLEALKLMYQSIHHIDYEGQAYAKTSTEIANMAKSAIAKASGSCV